MFTLGWHAGGCVHTVAAVFGPHWCTALGVGQITFTLG